MVANSRQGQDRSARQDQDRRADDCHDYVVEWNGKPVGSVKKAFKSACKAAAELGWYDNEIFQTDVIPHVLQHTAAIWLMKNGVSLTQAADYFRYDRSFTTQHLLSPAPRFSGGSGVRNHRQGSDRSRVVERCPLPVGLSFRWGFRVGGFQVGNLGL